MHIEYYGTPQRCLAAILADLQAIIGIKAEKREKREKWALSV